MSEVAAGWRSTHRGLSELDLRFREAAKDSPELLDRAQFRLLDEGSKLLRFRLQPWPTFVGAPKLAEIRRVSVEMCRLLRGVPERIFQNDPVKLAEFYRLPSPAMAEILFAPPTGADTMLARGDLIETAAGFQCIEFNFSPSLAGWDSTIITRLQLAAPPTARFIAGEGVQPAFTDTLGEMFRHVIADVRGKGGKGAAGARGLTIALLPDRKEAAVIAEQLEYLNREMQRTIAGMGLDLKGKVVGCLPEQLVFQGDRLLLASQQIDGVLELGGARTPPHVYRPFKAGLIGLYNGPMDPIFSDKRNLALLSRQASTAGYSSEEQAFIAAHVPWTRLVAPGEVDWEERMQPLAELLAAEPARFVLKKGTGYGGAGVVLGRFASPERWREALATALREGDWVAQETLESLPYLYQSGAYGCSIHDVIWGPFVFGERYGGVVLRMQPVAAGGPVNLTLQATEGIVLEV
jgi:hypothetical protein